MAKTETENKARGKRTFYPGKRQEPVTVNLTDQAHETLQIFETRANYALHHKVSRSDLIEHAIRTMGKLDDLNMELRKALRR